MCSDYEVFMLQVVHVCSEGSLNGWEIGEGCFFYLIMEERAYEKSDFFSFCAHTQQLFLCLELWPLKK